MDMIVLKREEIKKYILITIIIISLIVLFFIRKDKVEYSKNMNDKEYDVKEETLNKEIFGEYYDKANEKMKLLTLEEKIGQLFLVRYPNINSIEELEKYKFGGYLFFEKDFKDKTEEEVKLEIQSLQNVANIPLIIAVDEEGGKVVRVSSNVNLANEKFKSPSELYSLGGFDKIKADTKEKSKFLYNLGINLNLAPVVDVSTNRSDYIYQRTLGKDTILTSEYAKIVIEASKEGKVSYTLKHFPGYGRNIDTHNGISIDNKSYEDIKSYDLPPFKEGIEAGAEVILISHNIVKSIDPDNPASLSSKIHEVLRNELNFTGVTITDDLDMGAVSSDKDAVVKAILAGSDIIIVTDYKKSIEEVKKALEEGRIDNNIIEERALLILSWKYYKGML